MFREQRKIKRVSALALALTALLSWGTASVADAERPKVGFLSSVEYPDGPELRLVTRDGRELFGKIRSSTLTHGSMTKLTFRTFDGEKHKLRASDIQLVEMPVTDEVRGIMIDQSNDTLEEIWKADFERMLEVETLEFHGVRHPRSKRVALRQLINPGFDSRIQVYFLPRSKEPVLSSAKLPWFGDMPTAFLVVKDGAEPVRVKQWEYRKDVFPVLFADCPELLRRYQGDMRKFKFFAEHVYLYDQMCPGKGSPTYTGEQAEPGMTSK